MRKFMDWYGCYKKNWNGLIVPDAFQHPAKISYGLAEKIYQHLIENGQIKRGDRVVDPFGGIAGTALSAMTRGLHWTGVELEPKFHALGNANIALWNARYSSLPRWGTARLLCGDSRNLAQLIQDADCAVTSPPYADVFHGQDDKSSLEERSLRAGKKLSRGGQMTNPRDYGDTPGNLGNLREGSFDAAISSPPYEEARIGESSGAAQVGHGENYGSSAGQLGSMAGGDFDAAVSSQPFIDNSMNDTRPHGGIKVAQHFGISTQRHYGETVGQLGAESSETFWLASRQIVSQVHCILAPRGIAVFVCKDFVRNKERVPFCNQWRALCEAIGFEHLYTARAWLVEDNGTQLAHDGNHKRHVKSRKSFFRRLQEKNNPNVTIDFEEVIFMRKV